MRTAFLTTAWEALSCVAKFSLDTPVGNRPGFSSTAFTCIVEFGLIRGAWLRARKVHIASASLAQIQESTAPKIPKRRSEKKRMSEYLIGIPVLEIAPESQF